MEWYFWSCQDTPIPAFKHLLKYIYTGHISLASHKEQHMFALAVKLLSKWLCLYVCPLFL